MSRISSRNAVIYMGITTAAEASLLTYQNTYSLSLEFERIDVTAFGDSTKQYVAGIADASGEFAGFLDDASVQTYTAAIDGLPRKFYLYPSSLNTARYFFGTILADMTINGQVAGAAEVSSTWSAAGPFARVPATG
jgi:hypothetical protein